MIHVSHNYLRLCPDAQVVSCVNYCMYVWHCWLWSQLFNIYTIKMWNSITALSFVFISNEPLASYLTPWEVLTKDIKAIILSRPLWVQFKILLCEFPDSVNRVCALTIFTIQINFLANIHTNKRTNIKTKVCLLLDYHIVLLLYKLHNIGYIYRLIQTLDLWT